MFCEKCGAEILDGQKFCTNCGNKVEIHVEEEASKNDALGSLNSSKEEFNCRVDKKPSASGGNSELIKIIAIISIAVFGVSTFIYGINVIKSIFYFITSFFYYYGFTFVDLILGIMFIVSGFLMAVTCLAVAASGYVLYAHPDEEKDKNLLIVLGSVGVMIAGRIIAVILIWIDYGRFPKFRFLSTTTFIIAIIYAAVIYVLYSNMAVKSVMSIDRFKEAFAYALEVLKELNGKIDDKVGEDTNKIPEKVLLKKTGFWSYLFLGWITCGIYRFFSLHKLSKNINTTCYGDGRKTAGLVKLIILGFITCGIYYIVWLYGIAKRLNINADRYKVRIDVNGDTVLLWYLIGFFCCGIGPLVAIYKVYKASNMLVDEYNKINGFA